MSVKIGLCDDNNTFRESLEQFINDTPGYHVSLSVRSAENIEEMLHDDPPQIILMDINMPGLSGIEVTRIIKKKHPDLHVLILTVYEEEEKIFNAILAGASGYILKKTLPDKIIDAVREILDGGGSMSPLIVRKVIDHFNTQKHEKEEYNLSKQEKKVLQCLVDGHSYKMIATECKISMGTVRFHINNIYKKLHINSKSEAVAKVLKERLY